MGTRCGELYNLFERAFSGLHYPRFRSGWSCSCCMTQCDSGTGAMYTLLGGEPYIRRIGHIGSSTYQRQLWETDQESLNIRVG